MALRNFLIAGLSGTGKSTLCSELISRGIYALDADSIFGEHIDQQTGLPDPNKKQKNWVWNKQSLLAEINSTKEPILYICGGAMNEAEFYKYFEKRFYLIASNKTINYRLQKRLSSADKRIITDLKIQQRWNKNSKIYAESHGYIPINAELSPTRLADNIVSLSNL